jgi:putative sigma-54 modulation protein
MNISITFRHMDGTEAVKSYANEKISKLQKYLRQAMTAQVTLSVEGLDHIADVRIQSGPATYHAADKNHDMYASIDLVLDKLERQIRAYKGANVAKKHGAMRAGEFAAIVERESQSGSRQGGPTEERE